MLSRFFQSLGAEAARKDSAVQGLELHSFRRWRPSYLDLCTRLCPEYQRVGSRNGVDDVESTVRVVFRLRREYGWGAGCQHHPARAVAGLALAP